MKLCFSAFRLEEEWSVIKSSYAAGKYYTASVVWFLAWQPVTKICWTEKCVVKKRVKP